MSDSAAVSAKTKPENLLLNLVCNVALPTAIMSWASGPKALGPKWGLLVALIFPLGYGLHDFIQRRRFNFISAIGFVSILITGGFGLYKLNGFWFAVKDGALPALIGLAVLASMRAKEPLVRELLYNPQVVDVERATTTGFARGRARIEAVGDVDALELSFQNEHLIAQSGDETFATTPDLIIVLDAENGEPITTEGLRYGQRVRVVAAPSDPRWHTPEALAMVGPAYFGYDLPSHRFDGTPERQLVEAGA